MSETTIENRIALFEAKLATGKYDHYDDHALGVLFEDCINQCAFSEETIRRYEQCRHRA